MTALKIGQVVVYEDREYLFGGIVKNAGHAFLNHELGGKSGIIVLKRDVCKIEPKKKQLDLLLTF